MKKVFFIAIMALLACTQATAQNLRGIWISQGDNEGKILMFEFKAANVLEFTGMNLNEKKGGTVFFKYNYNSKKKIITAYPSSKDYGLGTIIYKIKWLKKNKIILTVKDTSLFFARLGTSDDLTSKKLVDSLNENQ